MTNFSPFRYVDKPRRYQVNDAFIAVLPRAIESKSALLEALASLLVFPTYFGFNWDALFDCVRDFSWLDKHNIVLIHPELPNLTRPELEIYLRLLRDAVLDWHPGETHRFDVIFAESDRGAVECFLQDG
ncbi:barstar family protein [Cupriavidus necator]|uniref:barstar family protein n=1 Tax=Cupriavidus necator TaxID=106590 RepID=UPI00339D373B